MSAGDLKGLLGELRAAGPVERVRLLARSLSALRRLSPLDRKVLLRMAGFEGAEALVERLAVGGPETAEALEGVLGRLEADPGVVKRLARALADPRRRGRALDKVLGEVDRALAASEGPAGEPAPPPPPAGASPAGEVEPSAREVEPEAEEASASGPGPAPEEPITPAEEATAASPPEPAEEAAAPSPAEPPEGATAPSPTEPPAGLSPIPRPPSPAAGPGARTTGSGSSLRRPPPPPAAASRPSERPVDDLTRPAPPPPPAPASTTAPRPRSARGPGAPPSGGARTTAAGAAGRAAGASP